MSNDSNVTAFPVEEDTFNWIGKIKGPKESVITTYKLTFKPISVFNS